MMKCEIKWRRKMTSKKEDSQKKGPVVLLRSVFLCIVTLLK